jgi:hypothetical protein
MKGIFAIIATLLTSLLTSGASGNFQGQQDNTDIVKPLLGCWQNRADKESLIRFEKGKCSFARSGKSELHIVRAAYKPGKIITYSWAHKTEYTFTLKDQLLSLTTPDGVTKTYRKLDTIPTEVEVKPLVLGKVQDLPPARIQAIQEDLARRAKQDQAVRTKRVPPEEMAKVDMDNTAALIKLVQEVGWIDAPRFGATAANNAFLLVQHSMHLPLMLAALPLIEQDVRAKRLNVQAYALLYDRVQIMLGEKQRYGTQIGTNEKQEMVVLPLADRQHVEELRKEIGLFPLSTYLKLFEKQNGGKPVTFWEDE